jgi:hypothetical protein
MQFELPMRLANALLGMIAVESTQDHWRTAERCPKLTTSPYSGADERELLEELVDAVDGGLRVSHLVPRSASREFSRKPISLINRSV